MDNRQIGAEFHVNPSTNQMIVIDTESGAEITRYAGYAFTLLPNGKFLYVDNVPQGFSDMAYYSLAVNGDIIYKSELKGYIIRDYIFYDNNSRVAVLQNNEDAEKGWFLALCEFDAESGTVTKQERYDIEAYNAQIYLNKDGLLRLYDDKNVYSVSEDGLAVENEKYSREQSIPEGTNGLTNIINAKLGEAKDGIYSITLIK
jgi:hypothetical protein